MEIKIGNGIDNILFGMSEAQLVRLIGEPDKVYTTDEDCRRLQYFTLQLEFSFEPENGNLIGWVEVHNPDAMLFGRKLIGLSRDEVMNYVNGHINEEPDIDDYGGFVSVTYEDTWLELQFEFGRLRCINFGVLYDRDGEPQWPAT